jgi:hypothetical protein
MMGPEIAILGFLAAAAFTIFYLVKSRHIERMAKIEHGIIKEEPGEKNYLILNLGIFLSFLGIGIFLSYLFSYFTNVPDYITMPGFLLLSGGLGLIISFFVNKRK